MIVPRQRYEYFERNGNVSHIWNDNRPIFVVCIMYCGKVKFNNRGV